METHRIDFLFPSSKQTEKAEGEVAIGPHRVSGIVDRLPSQKLKASYYVPLVFSLGPLHFGKPQLAKYETFKDELPDILVDRTGRPPFKNLVADMILQGSNIRKWYELLHIHICNDSDEELGWILARDGLFLLRFLRSWKASHPNGMAEKERLHIPVATLFYFIQVEMSSSIFGVTSLPNGMAGQGRLYYRKGLKGRRINGAMSRVHTFYPFPKRVN